MAPIKVLLADDHKLFRQGLSQICKITGGFDVVGEAENGQEALRLAKETRPDVILMDLNMPVLNGIQAIKQIKHELPETRIVALTIYQQEHCIFDAIKAGASGYLLKNVDAQVVLDAVRAVYRGEALVDSITAAKVLDEFRRLSETEADVGTVEELTNGEMAVLESVAEGMGNRQIADQLGLSEQTVSNRLRFIFQKLHVNNRTQAALFALRRGWASLEPDQDEA